MDVSPHERPLSPHLTVYRPQLTSGLSIFHRITGVLLTLGVFFLAFWLVAAAAGTGPYRAAQWFFGSWLGWAFLAGWSFCLFYHLCNGIRHLFWDMGKGFDLATTYRSGYLMVLAALALTAAAWAIGLLWGLGGA